MDKIISPGGHLDAQLIKTAGAVQAIRISIVLHIFGTRPKTGCLMVLECRAILGIRMFAHKVRTLLPGPSSIPILSGLLGSAIMCSFGVPMIGALL